MQTRWGLDLAATVAVSDAGCQRNVVHRPLGANESAAKASNHPIAEPKASARPLWQHGRYVSLLWTAPNGGFVRPRGESVRPKRTTSRAAASGRIDT